jgi:hypothetical protein
MIYFPCIKKEVNFEERECELIPTEEGDEV